MEFQQQFSQLRGEIINHPANQSYTDQDIMPLFQVSEEARLVLIGQAPGLKTQQAGQCFRDQSGDRLRTWLGLDEEMFYQSGKLAILPMDFYYPGKGKSGDLPPRPFVAETWHQPLLELMPKLSLTILIGQYAQAYYLQDSFSLTERVANYQNYLPRYLPLIHPSPRNNIWLKKHPWFEERVIPALQERVSQLLFRKD